MNVESLKAVFCAILFGYSEGLVNAVKRKIAFKDFVDIYAVVKLNVQVNCKERIICGCFNGGIANADFILLKKAFHLATLSGVFSI